MEKGRRTAIIGCGTNCIFIVNRPQTPHNIRGVRMSGVHLIGNLTCDKTGGIGADVQLVRIPIHFDLSFARPFAAGNDIQFVPNRILNHDPIKAVSIGIQHS